MTETEREKETETETERETETHLIFEGEDTCGPGLSGAAVGNSGDWDPGVQHEGLTQAETENNKRNNWHHC